MFFIVAFSNFFYRGESPGRSALETGSKWQEESLIEFLGYQVLVGKAGVESLVPLSPLFIDRLLKHSPLATHKALLDVIPS